MTTSVLLALCAVRRDLEDEVEPRVALLLRDYFMQPSLSVPIEWPDAWRELARTNARLGALAGRS